MDPLPSSHNVGESAFFIPSVPNHPNASSVVLVEPNEILVQDGPRNDRVYWTKSSMQAYCGHCRATVMTEVINCWFCWTPYVCCNNLIYIQHECRNCTSVLGTHRPKKFNQCSAKVIFGTALVIIITVIIYITIVSNVLLDYYKITGRN